MIIFQRPTTVRRPSAPSSAWRGDGIECTVRPSGSSAATVTARAAEGGDELKPDIEESDEGREAEPLERIAVVLFDAQRGRRPVALQALGSRPGLLQRDVGPQGQAGFGAERFEVEILPDGRRPRAAGLCRRRLAQLEQMRRRRRDPPGRLRPGRPACRPAASCVRSLKLRCTQPRCTSTVCSLPSSARASAHRSRARRASGGCPGTRCAAQPEPAQPHRPVQRRRGLVEREEVLLIERRKILLRIDRGLQRLFLRGAATAASDPAKGSRRGSAGPPP